MTKKEKNKIEEVDEGIEKEIDDILEDMIDDMGDGGMDVSYSGKNYQRAKAKAIKNIKDLIL